jgi:hypothetical protein
MEWLRAAVERGEPVDLMRLATLQAIDAVIAGEKFANEAVAIQQEADEQLRDLLANTIRR